MSEIFLLGFPVQYKSMIDLCLVLVSFCQISVTTNEI